MLKLPIWVVVDGAYAKKEYLNPAKARGVTVVSRLRKDAALRMLPGPKPTGRRRSGCDRPGQAGRPVTGKVIRHVRDLRGEGGQKL